MTAVLGRQQELAAIDAHLAHLADGRAVLVAVSGEAGIGKSTLLGEVATTLAHAGVPVLRIALSEVESHLGWAGLRLLAGGIGDSELAALPDAVRTAIPNAIGRGTSADVDPNLVAFALADVLERRAASGPIAVMVDDLHWLDPPTAGALAFAIRSNASRSIATVVAHRPVDLPIAPERLLGDDRRCTIELAGLSVAGVHRLLRERLDLALDRSDALRVHATTGGSPLHAMEIGRLLRRGVTLDDALVHPSAYDIIIARVEALPMGARAVLLTAAVAATPTVDALRRVHGDIDIVAELEPAVKQQLVELRNGAIAFTHPLARAATVAEAGTAARRSAQRLLADAVDDHDERIELLVTAADQPDASLAAEIDAAAGRAADRGDLPAALRLARRAADLTPAELVDRRSERLLTAADLAASTGDGHTPIELAEAAERLRGDDPDVAFRAGVIKVLALGNRGDELEGVAITDALLERFDGHPVRRARLFDLRAQSALRRDVGQALDEARAALGEALAGGDGEQIEREQALLAMVSVLAGEPVDLPAIEAATERLPDSSIAKDWYADALSFSDRSHLALAISTAQLAEYQRLGLVHYEAPVRARIVGDLIALGRYAEAIRHATEWFDLQALVGGIPASSIQADTAFARVVLGDVERGTSDYAVAERDTPIPIDEIAVLTRGCQIAAAIGDWTSVAARAERARAIAATIGMKAIGCAPFRIDAVDALVQLGRIADAAAIGAEHEAIAAHNGAPRGVPDCARIRAVLAGAEGDHASAAASWPAAIDGYAALGLALEEATSMLGAGGALRRAGKRAEARRLLDAARERFTALGAVPYLARVDAELQRMGTRRNADATQLTPTERQVAELVAAGKSNAEIAATLMVSVRTVESNLTRAYRKLNVRRRTELAAVLRG